MAVTAISDIINPEVLADQLSAKFPDKLVLGQTALVKVDDTFPLGSPGTVFKIPSWKRIPAFASIAEGVAMTPGKISSLSEFAVVQRGGAAFEVYDTAELVSKADPVSEIADQISRRAAEYIDNALVLEVNKTPNTFDTSTGIATVWNNGANTNVTGLYANAGKTMDQNVIITGLVQTLGDNYGAMLGGGMIIMHSKVFGDLLQTGAIQNQYQSGANVILSGALPTLLGMPVLQSDLVTQATVSAKQVYNTYVIGREALALFYQREVMVEFDRDILLQADIVAGTTHFAPHLFGYDDQGAVTIAEQGKSIHAVVLKSN
jgi:hypothetical protein